MARAKTAGPALAVPWEERLSFLLPVSAPVQGVVYAALLLGVTFAVHAVLGAPILDHESSAPLPLSGEFHAALTMSMLLAFGLSALRLVVEGNAADLVELGWSATRGGAPWAAEGSGVDAGSLPGSRVAGAVVVIATAATFVGVALSRSLVTLTSVLHSAWPVCLTLLLAWCAGRAAFFTVWGVGRATDRSAELAEIDLLELAPLRSYGRVGLRLSLVWLMGASLAFVLLLFDPNPGDAPPATPFLVSTLAIALLALLIPVRGVQRRIRAAKRSELAGIDAALRALRDAERAGEAPAPGRRADLLAQRAHTEGLGEWPFDASTLVRFALYLLIPLASWLGGALVERGLGWLLD